MASRKRNNQIILEPTEILPKLAEQDYTAYLGDEYYFDPTDAENVILFSEDIRFTEGEWAGQPFRFTDWQIYRIIVPVFGIKSRATGMRRFRTIFVYIPRKNGKSGFASALSLFLLACDKEPRPKIYGAAKDEKQAKIVFDEAVLMAESDYEEASERGEKSHLSTIFTTYRNKIVCPITRGVYSPISRESRNKDGLNAHATIVDELHEFDIKGEDVIDKLKRSMSTRRQPLEIYLTTAGICQPGNEQIWEKMYERAKAAMLDPDEEPDFLPVIYEAAEGADPFDPATWYDANPSLKEGIKKLWYMEKMAKEAAKYPSEFNNFCRYELNIKQKAESSWIGDDVWLANIGDHTFDSLAGRPVYLGIDLSSTRDFTACGLYFPPHELDIERGRLLCKKWLPSAKMEEREKKENKRYKKWQKEGFFDVTRGNVVDYDVIIEFVINSIYKYDVKGLAYDAWNSSFFITTLKKKLLEIDKPGFDPEEFKFIVFRQGFKTMSPACKDFERMLCDGKLFLPVDDCLRNQMACVMLDIDPTLGIKPNKVKSSDHIDGIVASIMAHGAGNLDLEDEEGDPNEHYESNDYTMG